MEEQSNPSFERSVIKTNLPLNDDLAQEEYLWQRYRKRIGKLSQQDRLSKFCTDAGFLNVVEIGQFFMTKDTEEFSQFNQWHVVSTLYHEMKNQLTRKVGFE